MRITLHLFLHDLRRMAPWVLAYLGLLAWRLFRLDPASTVASKHYLLLLQEVGLVVVLGILVLDQPLFARRAFWRTRAIGSISLLRARLLFAAVALWLPRLLAQYAGLRILGLDHETLLALVMLDVAFSQALWIASILFAVSCCRRHYQLLFVVFGVFFFLPFDRYEGVIAPPERLVRHLGHSAMGWWLAMACILLLFALYQQRWERMKLGVLCALLAPLVAIPIASTIVGIWAGEPTIEAPTELELVPTDSVRYRRGRRAALRLTLAPRNLDPRSGLQVLSLEGTASSPTGDVLPIAANSLVGACSLPESGFEALRSLDDRGEGLLACGDSLELDLLALDSSPRGSDSAFDGRLELRLRLRAFRGRLQRVEATPGSSIHHRLDSFALVEVEAPEQGDDHPRFHLVHFYPFYPGLDRDRHDLGGAGSSLRFFDPEGSELLEVLEQGVHSSSELAFFIPYARLAVSGIQVRSGRRSTSAEIVSHEGPPNLEMLSLDPIWSDPFELVVRIESFGTDHLDSP